MSITAILQYYAIISLTMMPISVGLVIYLSRKTDILDRMDDALDKLTGKKKETKDNKKEPEKETKPTPAEDKKEEPIPELEGIASFRLPVGDIYYCELGSQNRVERLYTPQWETSNDFIGKIDENGVFSALKAGTVTVTVKKKDDPFDEGSTVYQILVTPLNEGWFAEGVFNAILQRKKKDDVLRLLSTRKITSETPGKKIIRYDAGAEDRSLTIQFNANGEIARAAFSMRNSGNRYIEELEKELAERFEPVPLKSGKGVSIWMHRDSNAEHDEVDGYAFIRNSQGRPAVLGIAQAWREYGEVEEFLKNIGMTLKLFSDCLPEEKPVAIEAEPAAKDGTSTPGNGTAKETEPEKKEEIQPTAKTESESPATPTEEKESPEDVAAQPAPPDETTGEPANEELEADFKEDNIKVYEDID